MVFTLWLSRPTMTTLSSGLVTRAKRDREGRHCGLDRQVAHRLRAVLSDEREVVRGAPPVLRQPVLAGRGGLHLLRNAEEGELGPLVTRNPTRLYFYLKFFSPF